MTQLQSIARWLLAVNLEGKLIAFKRIALSEATVVGRASQEAKSLVSEQLIKLLTQLQHEGQLQSGDAAEMAEYLINTLVLAPMTSAMLGDETVATEQWQEGYFERIWPRIVVSLSAQKGSR